MEKRMWMREIDREKYHKNNRFYKRVEKRKDDPRRRGLPM